MNTTKRTSTKIETAYNTIQSQTPYVRNKARHFNLSATQNQSFDLYERVNMIK